MKYHLLTFFLLLVYVHPQFFNFNIVRQITHQGSTDDDKAVQASYLHGNKLVYGMKNGEIRKIDYISGTVQAVYFTELSGINGIFFQNSDQVFIGLPSSNSLRKINISSQLKLKQQNFQQRIFTHQFEPKNRQIIASFIKSNQKLGFYIIDMDSFSINQTKNPFSAEFKNVSLYYSNKGDYIFAVNKVDNSIRIINKSLSSWNVTKIQYTDIGSFSINSAAFSHDDSKLYTCDSGGKIRYHQLSSGYLIYTTKLTNSLKDPNIKAISVTKNSSDFLILVSAEDKVLFDFSTSTVIQLPQPKHPILNANIIQSSSDGKYLILQGTSTVVYSVEFSMSLICSPKCQKCQGFATNCTSCKQNYVLLSSNNTCDCPITFYEAINICRPCDYNCLTCLNQATFCLTCKQNYELQIGNICVCPDGYYKDSNYLCLNCDKNCLECENSAKKCISCRTNYIMQRNGTCICPWGFLESANICTSCDVNCRTCRTTLFYCLTCRQNYILKYDNTCECPFGFFQSQNKCLRCDQSCLSCRNESTTCLSCASSYIRRGYSCICPYGYYRSWNMCLPCDSNCQTCWEYATYCLTCKYNYELQQNNTCICPQGFFRALELCLICDRNCLTCETKSTFCLTCRQNYTLETDNTCLCPSGYFQSQSACSICNQNCLTCQNSSTTCISCRNNYILEQENFCRCPIGYYKKSKNCFQCSINCLSCKSKPTYCLTCHPNYILNETTNACECPLGYFSPLNNLDSCLPCTSPCASCQHFSNKCLSCVTGFQLLQNHSCQLTNNQTSNQTGQPNNSSNESHNAVEYSQAGAVALAAAKAVASIPAINKAPTLKFIMLLFDHLWLYHYADYNQTGRIKVIMDFIVQVQSQKFVMLDLDSALGLENLTLPFSNYSDYSHQKRLKIEQRSDLYMENVEQYFFYSVLMSLILYIIMRVLFRLLFKYKISIWIRKFSFVGFYFVIVAENNVQYISYISMNQAQILFSIKWIDKGNHYIWCIAFFFFVFYSVCIYFLLYYFYEKLGKYFVDSMKTSLSSFVYYSYIMGFRGLVVGSIHSLLYYDFYTQMICLGCAEMSIVLFSLFLQARFKPFLSSLFCYGVAIHHFMIFFFNLVIICDKIVKSRDDSESWDPMMDSFIDIAVYGLGGSTIFQIMSGFAPGRQNKKRNEHNNQSIDTIKQPFQGIQNQVVRKIEPILSRPRSINRAKLIQNMELIPKFQIQKKLNTIKNSQEKTANFVPVSEISYIQNQIINSSSKQSPSLLDSENRIISAPQFSNQKFISPLINRKLYRNSTHQGNSVEHKQNQVKPTVISSQNSIRPSHLNNIKMPKDVKRQSSISKLQIKYGQGNLTSIEEQNFGVELLEPRRMVDQENKFPLTKIQLWKIQSLNSFEQL